MPESNKKFDKQNRSDFSENLDQFNPDDSNFITPIDLLQTLSIPVEIRITVLERITIFSMIDHGDIESLESYLNSPEVDLTVKDSIGETPLHVAVENNNYQIVQLLLEHGADVNILDDYNDTPLHLASAKDLNISIVQLLLEHGADVEIRENRNGDTPLHLASYNGNYQIVQLLLEHGANVDSRDFEENTPLHQASINKHYSIVHFFSDIMLTLILKTKTEQRR